MYANDEQNTDDDMEDKENVPCTPAKKVIIVWRLLQNGIQIKLENEASFGGSPLRFEFLTLDQLMLGGGHADDQVRL